MKIFCLGIALLAAISLAGCGSNVTQVSEISGILGSWKTTTLNQDGGTVVNCAGTLVVAGVNKDVCGANDVTSFNTDGSLTRTASAGNSTGVWSISGNTMTVTYSLLNGVAQSPLLVKTMHYSLTSINLTLRPINTGVVENGETITLARLL